MKASLLRLPAARQLTSRRFATASASTAQSAAQKATQTASKAASKAQDAAKVAISTLVSAAGGLGASLSKAGGRTGQLVKGAEALIPQTIYYSKVALELSKLVFHGQNMPPPDVGTFQKAFTPIIDALKNPRPLLDKLATSPAFQTASILARYKSLSRIELAQAGVLVAETLGFYTVGTMIGRRKIVGYRHGNSNH